jgi:hypothetical protein
MEYLYLLPLLLLVISNIIILRVRIKASLEYLRNEEDDNLTISFYAMKGLFRYKYEVPVADFGKGGIKFKLVKEQGGKAQQIGTRKEKMKSSGLFEKYETVRSYIQANNEFLCDLRDYLRPRLLMYQFRLFVEEGTGNASQTGIICGLLWSVVGVVTSLLSNNFKTFEKRVAIKPDFCREVFNVDFKCIFRMRIVHIIVLVTKIYLNGNKERKMTERENIAEKRNRRKGGDGEDGGAASYRRTYENSYGKHQGNG